VFKARCWPHLPGTYFQTLESLLQSTKDDNSWKQCYLTGADTVNLRFQVKWAEPQTDLGKENCVVSEKLASELLIPGETLREMCFFKESNVSKMSIGTFLRG
jgi:hypothetical protein